MKQKGILVVSLKGVNFGFLSSLGCSTHSTNILSCQEAHNYAKRSRSYIFFLTCFRICVFLSGIFRESKSAYWSPLGVTRSLSHAQMVSFRG